MDEQQQKLLMEFAEFLSTADHPGLGWFTASELAEVKGVTYQKIAAYLRKEVENGKVETTVVGHTTYFRRRDGT